MPGGPQSDRTIKALCVLQHARLVAGVDMSMLQDVQGGRDPDGRLELFAYAYRLSSCALT